MTGMFNGRGLNIQQAFAAIVHRRNSNVFLIDANSGREISYSDFDTSARALAAELQRRGLRKNDRVAVMFPNCCELAIVYFACIYAGLVIVPINPSLSKIDVDFILSNCQPRLVITSHLCSHSISRNNSPVISIATGPIHKECAPANPNSENLNLEGPLTIDDLPAPEDFVPFSTTVPEDLIAIMYTSGTSAKPKGLAHKLGSMLRNATAFAEVQHIDEETRFYLTLSMSYMGGFYNLLILPFLCGASVVVDHVFDARSSLHFWEKAQRHNVNALWLAPTVMSILLRMDRGRTGEQFCRNSIRHAFVGFAPLPLKVKDEFESRYGLHLIENYGLSETLFVSARGHDRISARGYVGEPLPGIQLRTIDEHGETTPPMLDGEIQIQTPDLMAGYLDRGGELIPIDSSDWFPTGDIGRLDKDGSLLVTGRKKDLIIRGGVNISPAAIEESLMQVSGVLEAAVVSIPHELYGEDIVAVLKLDASTELEDMLDALIAHARTTLAQHQQPARYIAMDEFPKTSNGKVKKSRIRELVAEKLHLGTVSPGQRSAEMAASSK